MNMVGRYTSLFADGTPPLGDARVWLPIVVNLLVALGTFAVAVIAIWQDWFRARFTGPRLRISTETLRGNLMQTTGGQKRIFHNLRVVNDRSWSVARGCTVLLRRIERRNVDGRFVEVPLAFEPPFTWAPSEYAPMRPDVSGPLVIDLGYVAEPRPVDGHPPGDRFHPNLYFWPGNFEGYVYPNQVVRYYLEVRAENYAPKELTVIEISWNGVWTDDVEAMRTNLVRREVDPDDRMHRHRTSRSMAVKCWPLM
jgi:hypothetical protein